VNKTTEKCTLDTKVDKWLDGCPDVARLTVFYQLLDSVRNVVVALGIPEGDVAGAIEAFLAERVLVQFRPVQVSREDIRSLQE
jgi:hypothetical protein